MLIEKTKNKNVKFPNKQNLQQTNTDDRLFAKIWTILQKFIFPEFKFSQLSRIVPFSNISRFEVKKPFEYLRNFSKIFATLPNNLGTVCKQLSRG